MFDDRWNAQWFKDRVTGREATFRCIGEICREMECETLLDVGGGIGSLNIFLPSHMKHDVVDLSPKSKSIGKNLSPKVIFITGTIEDVVGNYDAVVALSLIEHLEGYTSFLKAIWARTNKVACISFRNGLDDKDEIRLHGRDYWDNKYSYPQMERWIETELHPKKREIKKVEVKRDYSPELVLVLTKEEASG